MSGASGTSSGYRRSGHKLTGTARISRSDRRAVNWGKSHSGCHYWVVLQSVFQPLLGCHWLGQCLFLPRTGTPGRGGLISPSRRILSRTRTHTAGRASSGTRSISNCRDARPQLPAAHPDCRALWGPREELVIRSAAVTARSGVTALLRPCHPGKYPGRATSLDDSSAPADCRPHRSAAAANHASSSAA